MKTRRTVEYIHEGRYAAEVDVTLFESDTEWSPYYSLEDVEKLEKVRDLLRSENLAEASTIARIFEMKPIAAE